MGPFDDFNGPWTAVREGIEKLLPTIDPIGKDVAQPRELHPYLLQQRYRAVAVLDVGWMHMNPEKEAIGVGYNVPLAAVDAFPRV